MDRFEKIFRDLFTAYGWQAGVTVLIVLAAILLLFERFGVDWRSFLGF